MNSENYNLIDEPWIPVVFVSGENGKVSLGTLFSAEGETIADLALNPYERISVMRLLICIALAALGDDVPKDESDWRMNTRRLLVPAVRAYFEKWHDRFNLFGEHAFMQPDDLSVEKDSDRVECSKLFPHLASGNGGTLYDHVQALDQRHFEPSILILGLLVYLNYSAGGRHSKCIWGREETSKSVSLCPSREKSMLQTFLIGQNVMESVCLNVPTHDDVKFLPLGDLGLPFWEADNLSRENVFGHGWEDTVMGRLVPLARVAKLNRETVLLILGEGLKYRQLPESRELFASVVVKKGKDAECTYVAASNSKMPWRDLHAILEMSRTHGSVLLQQRIQNWQGRFCIWCGGLVTNQAKNEGVVEWRVELDSAMLSDVRIRSYRSQIEAADHMAGIGIKNAARKYAELMKMDNSQSEIFRKPTERRYWEILSNHQKELLEMICTPGRNVEEEWSRIVRDAAVEAFTDEIPHSTGRQMEAFTLARRELFKGLVRKNSKNKEEAK